MTMCCYYLNISADRMKILQLLIALAAAIVPCWCVLDITGLRGFIQGYHNYLRTQEPAADMKYMTWDRGLEARAGQWADGCVFEHQMRGYGENLAFVSSTGSPVSNEYSIRNAMSNWHAEKRLWNGGTGFCGSACHYTQLIWSRTSRLGCAINLCAVLSDGRGRTWRNAKYFVCFYSPQGNWIGEQTFTPGPRCSRCPPLNRCFQGLCVGPDSPRVRGRRSTQVDSHWACQGQVECSDSNIKRNCPNKCN